MDPEHDIVSLPGSLGGHRLLARGSLAKIALANLGYAHASYLGFLIILPDRAGAIGGHAHKTVLLAAVAAAGAVIALPTGIVAGRQSDRLLASRGSRRSVLVSGAVFCLSLLVYLPFSRSAVSLLLAWCGLQIGLNVVFIIITVSLVDWFAIEERGRASSFAGIGQVAGALVASGLAVTLGGHLAALSASCAATTFLTILPAALTGHQVHPGPPGEPVTAAHSARGGYRDVRLAFSVRVVVTFANTLVFTFANYYVSDVLRVRDPQRFVGIVAGEMAVLILTGAVAAGRASDRSGRRRPYVTSAVLLMCAGEVILASWRTTSGVVIACALVGLGYGTYLSVDQALTADVLPDPRRFGRDVGIMNAAISAPQVAAPALAALLVGGSGNYAALFYAGAVITLSGAALVLPIRAVR